MSSTDQCPSCGGDCGMSNCPRCGGCENTGTQPCPACQPPPGGNEPECIWPHPECPCDDCDDDWDGDQL